VSKVGTYQVREHGDEVHGDGDGHVMMIKCSTWKRRKRKTKTKMIKAKVYDRSLF
jgi:hypothetical protein